VVDSCVLSSSIKGNKFLGLLKVLLTSRARLCYLDLVNRFYRLYFKHSISWRLKVFPVTRDSVIRAMTMPSDACYTNLFSFPLTTVFSA
jgi:hypothetical protein